MSHNDAPVGLQSGQMLPLFTLPGPDGMPYSPLAYKQREHLTILFLQNTSTPEVQELLRAYAAHYADFREEYCAILAVTTNTVIANLQAQETLRLPFPLLADPQGEVSRRYTSLPQDVPHPSVVLADRYGEVYQQWSAEQVSGLPPIAELLASLQYLNKLCTP